MPSVRARHLKVKLEVISRMPRGDAVLARLGPVRRAQIEQAHGLDWLPIELELAQARAAYDALGPEGARAMSSAIMTQALRGPLFGPIARAGLQLVGREATTWSDLVRKGWRLVFRGCGDWSMASAGPHAHAMRLEDLPPECAGDVVWLTSLSVSLSVVVAYLGVEGHVVLVEHGVDSRAAVFRAEWRPRP